MITTGEPPDLIADLIKELPVGAVKTWEGVGLLISGSNSPIYIFVVEIQGKNPMLQFKEPKMHIMMYGDVMRYVTGETICNKQYFNRSFLPTFFVFDNYLHAYAFEQKLAKAGYTVQKQKFK